MGRAAACAGRALVRLIDSCLVRAYRVEEFTQDPTCMLRIARGRAAVRRILPDGTVVSRGDATCELHLWNERLPRIDARGPQLAWGRAFLSGLTRSLGLISSTIDRDPRYADSVCLHGASAAMGSAQQTSIERASRALGCDFEWAPVRTDAWGRIASFWVCLYHYALIWTFNPGSLGSKRLAGLRRYQLWMARGTLRNRYGSGGARH